MRPALLGLLALVTHSVVLSDLHADGRLVAAPPEEILTSDGRRFRGRVVGYDADSKGYILRSGERELTIPEGDILTIRSVESLAPLPSTPATSEAPEGAPEAIIALEKSRRGEGTRQLRALLEGLDALPRPADPAVAERFDAALGLVRDGRLTRALHVFREARESAPRDLICGLFLGACQLAEREYRSAYRELRALVAQHPEEPVALDLLARAARDLGYQREAAEVAERSIRLRFSGAESRYRVFALRLELNLDPELTREAWRAYLFADPELGAVDSLEARFFRRGKEALSRGDYRLALDALATATEINPFLHDAVRPYRIKGLELRALAARERGDFELFFGDMAALARTAPERAEEFEYRRREGEAAMVRSGLESAESADELDRLISQLEVWVRDLRTRHATAVRDRAESLVRRAIFRGQVPTAVDVLGFLATLDWPGLEVRGIRRELLEYLEEQVRMDLEEGRHDAVREWARGVEKLAPRLAGRWRDVLAESGAGGRPAMRSPALPAARPPGARPRDEGTASSPDRHEGSATPVRAAEARPPAPEPVATPSVVTPTVVTPSSPPTGAPAAPSENSAAPSRAPAGSPEEQVPAGAESPQGAAVVSTPEAVDTDGAVGPPSDESALQRYFPLVPGSRWIYRHVDGTLDHQHLERVEASSGEDGIVHRFSNRFVVGDLNIAYARSCFSDGEYIFVGPGTDRDSADRFLRLPVVPGQRWSWRVGSIVYEKSYEAMDATVVCAAGVFTDCLKVKSVSRYDAESTHTVSQWLYFARDVGLVKVVSENPADGIELLSYEIAGSSPSGSADAASDPGDANDPSGSPPREGEADQDSQSPAIPPSESREPEPSTGPPVPDAPESVEEPPDSPPQDRARAGVRRLRRDRSAKRAIV